MCACTVNFLHIYPVIFTRRIAVNRCVCEICYVLCDLWFRTPCLRCRSQFSLSHAMMPIAISLLFFQFLLKFNMFKFCRVDDCWRWHTICVRLLFLFFFFFFLWRVILAVMMSKVCSNDEAAVANTVSYVASITWYLFKNGSDSVENVTEPKQNTLSQRW